MEELQRYMIFHENQQNIVLGAAINSTSSPTTSQQAEPDYRTWNRNETKNLIFLYKKYRNEVGSLKIRSMKRFWEIIADIINKELGTNVTGAQCENRWRVLERNYKKYVDNNKKTGRGRKTFEYTEEFEEIFGKKRNIHPELLLTEDSVVQKPQTNLVNQSKPSCDMPSPSMEIEEPLNDEQAINEENNCKIKISNKNRIKIGKKKRSRNDVLENIRNDRMKYYEERLKLQKEQFAEKMVVEMDKLREIQNKNRLIEERNEILKKSNNSVNVDVSTQTLPNVGHC